MKICFLRSIKRSVLGPMQVIYMQLQSNYFLCQYIHDPWMHLRCGVYSSLIFCCGFWVNKAEIYIEKTLGIMSPESTIKGIDTIKMAFSSNGPFQIFIIFGGRRETSFFSFRFPNLSSFFRVTRSSGYNFSPTPLNCKCQIPFWTNLK